MLFVRVWNAPQAAPLMLDTMDASIFSAPDPLNCRILLAEDDCDHQPLLCLMLKKSGSEVTVAENGRRAVELAHEARDAGRPFDLIVMDLQMPVLDGLSATRQLRDEGFSIPIIALTARAVSTDRDRCFAAGCDDFLSKPVSRGDLIRLLATHLKRARLVHAHV